MSQKDEWKKSLDNDAEKCDDFLKKTKDATDLVPAVEHRRKEIEAKIVFVESMPEPVLTELGRKLFTFQLHDEAQLRQNLPGLPSITPEAKRYLTSGTSDSSAYTVIIHTCLEAPNTKLSQTEVESINKVSMAFSDLANDKSRKLNLPPLLNKINNQLGDKFIVALESYEKAKNRIVGIDQSAIQLRDVLEQLWGGMVNMVRQKDPRKYKGVELNLDPKGKKIAVDCLATDDIGKQKLTLLLETLSTIKSQLSETEFGKNPLANNLEKLTELYGLWVLVISDLTDFIKLNLYIN